MTEEISEPSEVETPESEIETRKSKIGKTQVAILAAILVVGVLIGRCSSPDSAPPQTAQQTDESVTWTCSMHPQVQSEEFGQCPICGMDLIPVDSNEDSGNSNRVTMSERAKKLAQIRTTPVRRLGDASREMRLLGRVERDETRAKTVTTWTAGRIDKLYVASKGEKIRRGQVIATLYSPEIYAAHRDLIQAKRQLENLSSNMDFARSSAEATLESARQKLRLLGVSSTDLAAMEKTDKPWTAIKVRSPFGGTVTEKLVDEGNYVQAGTGVYKLSDLSKLWLQLDAYESDLSRLRLGQKVSFAIDAIPEATFTGTIAFIDPILDPVKRTANVRVEVDNDGDLRPGMFATATVEANRSVGETPPLVIPSSAPLFAGRRSLVYVELGQTKEPTYEAREVLLGPKAGDIYPVLAGLSFGERVVTNGAFAIDADLQIKGGGSLMTRSDDRNMPPADIIETPPEFNAELTKIIDAYIALQESLADDDWEASQNNAKTFIELTKAFHPSQPAHASEVWTQIREGLNPHHNQMEIARDLDGAREVFDAYSQAMTKILAHFGNPTGGDLKLAYCPMAFDNRGAEWIQRGDKIDNSYFGSNMLLCGEFRQTIPTGTHIAPKGDE